MPNARSMDPLILLGSVILFAAALTWIIPAGQYERLSDSRSGAITVVPGSYKYVPSHPIGLGGLLLSIPTGLIRAASIIFYVLISGAALTVVEQTGSIGATLDVLTKYLAGRQLLVLPVVSLLFLFGGAAYSMSEEIIAFIPLLCVLMRRLRLPNTMAVAVSFGSASVAAAFSPSNTFLLGVSQPLLGLPLFSGFAFRSLVCIIAISTWLAYLLVQAARMRALPNSFGECNAGIKTQGDAQAMSARHYLVLIILNVGLALMILGAMRWSGDLNEFSALFIAMTCPPF